MTVPVAPRALFVRSEFKPGVWTGDTAPTQFYDPVNFTKLALTSQKQETVELLSNMESNYGQVLASVPKPTDSAKIDAEADYMSPWMFGLLLGADITELSQTTGAVADENVTLALGVWVPLANKYLAAHGTGTEIVLETPGTPDVEVANTKYSVDLINGLVKATHADAVGVKKISYHKATRGGEIYKSGQAKSAYIKLVGTGTEMVSQKRCRIVIHKALLVASSEWDIASSADAVKGAFTGTLLTPSGETSPWQFEYLDQSA